MKSAGNLSGAFAGLALWLAIAVVIAGVGYGFLKYSEHVVSRVLAQ